MAQLSYSRMEIIFRPRLSKAYLWSKSRSTGFAFSYKHNVYSEHHHFESNPNSFGKLIHHCGEEERIQGNPWGRPTLKLKVLVVLSAHSCSKMFCITRCMHARHLWHLAVPWNNSYAFSRSIIKQLIKIVRHAFMRWYRVKIVANVLK